MKRRIYNTATAFTLIDLLVVVAVVAVIGALMVTAGAWLGNAKARAIRIACVSDVKQCGLAFQVWSSDNNGKFPMQVSTNSGGTLEFVPGGNTFRHFQVMSNELSTPMVVGCPSDTRDRATNFTDFNNQNVSLFVGLDAHTNSPQEWLCGDRNLTNGFSSDHTVLKMTTGQSAGWTREMHNGCGNIGFADGSVQQTPNRYLQEMLRRSIGWTNKIALPE